MTIEELKGKFPEANHLPLETCERCSGTGVDAVAMGNAKRIGAHYADIPCMCIFVDHEQLPLMRSVFNDTLKKISDEIKAGSTEASDYVIAQMKKVKDS